VQYWDDPADETRDNEGMLLPLWTFSPALPAVARAVTALAWSPHHPDLFVAGYGAFDPGKPVTGLICAHSFKVLKIPSILSSSIPMRKH